MHIHALYRYPVKSLAGLEVTELALDRFGPALDRRWMVVDSGGQFVTQRKLPKLALVTPTLDAPVVAGGPFPGLAIDVPGEGCHPLVPGPRWRTVSVWGDPVEALAADPGPSEALSRYLSQPVELVWMPDAAMRNARTPDPDSHYAVSFADGFPFLIVQTGSLDDLNQRLQTPVSITRFRPNLVISGADPWAEDHWQQLETCGVVLEMVKPCSRCVMTTVDPATGEKDPAQEPLRTLTGFRRFPDGVMFGINAVHRGAGSLRVGAPVRILEID